ALSPLVPFISARSVFTSHDVLNESQFEGFRGRLKKVLIPFALNRYKKIHSVSKDAEDNLLNTLPGISKAKSLVISNGVDTERFYSAKPVDLRSKLSLPEDSIIV